jgi:hypothetical protein
MCSRAGVVGDSILALVRSEREPTASRLPESNTRDRSPTSPDGPLQKPGSHLMTMGLPLASYLRKRRSAHRSALDSWQPRGQGFDSPWFHPKPRKPQVRLHSRIPGRALRLCSQCSARRPCLEEALTPGTGRRDPRPDAGCASSRSVCSVDARSRPARELAEARGAEVVV